MGFEKPTLGMKHFLLVNNGNSLAMWATLFETIIVGKVAKFCLKCKSTFLPRSKLRTKKIWKETAQTFTRKEEVTWGVLFWLMVLAGWREASKWRHRNLRRAHYSHFKNLFLINLTHFIWVFRNIRTHAIGSISFVHKLRITVVVGVVVFVVGVVSIIFMTTFLTTFVHTFKSVHELKNKDFLKGAFRLVASCCRIAVDCVNAGKENLLLA